MTARRPLPLYLALVVVSLQALALLVCAIWILADLGAGVAGGGIQTAIFFLACAAGVGACVWGLWRLRTWSRAPIVLVQLILLGTSWDMRSNTAASIGLIVVAVVVLVGIFHPASLRAMEQHDPDQVG